jgi:malate synthase
VAAVDADDKAEVYRNWLGLMKGTLTDTFEKGGKQVTRTLAPGSPVSRSGKGQPLDLHGRALLLVRNVGHLMTNEAMLLKGEEVPEGILDAVITATIALHDLRKSARCATTRAPARCTSSSRRCTAPRKSRSPCEVFDRVEDKLGCAPTPSRSASWTRSAAPRSTSRNASARRKRARHLHQHRLPRPHRRRNPHLDGSRPDGAQERR